MNFIDLDGLAGLAPAPITPSLNLDAKLHADAEAAFGSDHDIPRSPRDACVMIVDDESLNIEIVRAYLEEKGFVNFLTTTDSTSAVDMARSHLPDIVLLDIRMPQVSGLDILKSMRGDDRLRKIPVIIVTTSTEPAIKLQALRLGASEFLAKPVDPSELLLRIENALNLKACQDQLASYSRRLEDQVRIRTEELLRSRREAILCLARAAEYRDDDTGQHVTRVGRYSAIIADQLGFPRPAIELIEQAAQLHDVGKIGIPDSILHKPGKLESDEFSQMKSHCGIGRQIIRPLSDEECEVMQQHTSMGMRIMACTTSPILKMAAVIADTHHEKWDGTGYPRGLAGKQIPIEGRIVAVADVFDALSSKRPYKEAFPIEKCLSILAEGRGNHFDPRVLDAFMIRKEEIIRVRRRCVTVHESLDEIIATAPSHSAGNQHVR